MDLRRFGRTITENFVKGGRTRIEGARGPTLSVRMPQSSAFESVSSAASALRAAIRRHTSSTVVLSGTVSARDSRSRFTVRSPPMVLHPCMHAPRVGQIWMRSQALMARSTCYVQSMHMRVTSIGTARAWGCRPSRRQRPRGVPWRRRSPSTASAAAVTCRRPLLRTDGWSDGRDQDFWGT